MEIESFELLSCPCLISQYPTLAFLFHNNPRTLNLSSQLLYIIFFIHLILEPGISTMKLDLNEMLLCQWHFIIPHDKPSLRQYPLWITSLYNKGGKWMFGIFANSCFYNSSGHLPHNFKNVLHVNSNYILHKVVQTFCTLNGQILFQNM